MKELKTRGGRKVVAIGEESLLTMDRLHDMLDRFDTDPRIVSVSLYPGNGEAKFTRATGPAGAVTLITTEIEFDPDTGDLTSWSQDLSNRGFWHDWYLIPDRDVKSAEVTQAVPEIDQREATDPSGSHFHNADRRAKSQTITLAVDVTWLGPHQTGAQVLTTAAIQALAANPRISQITLTGLTELPGYAAHLTDLDTVSLATESDSQPQADVIWYPNQIDQRVDIGKARELGRRIVTTYLDLIAYDIPRYHGSTDGWAAYRSLQRRVALSVDGITTISADVAKRLYQEVPMLSTKRITPIPLGLNHLTSEQDTNNANNITPIELTELPKGLGNKPFLLVLGNDFSHKNRDIAIQAWQLVLQQGIQCDLVLAGLHVKSSSSKDREDVLLKSHADLRGKVFELGHVSDEVRQWLLANAAVAVYPSSAEGFGFVPYEAAIFGTPSTFTSFGPLAELTSVTNGPKDWSPENYATDIAQLLTDQEFARQRVATLQSVIAELTWERFATELTDFFFTVSAMPPVLTSAVASTTSDTAALASVLNSKVWRASEKARRVKSKFTRN
jgi:glycosyltransferase involved in cell wall biosynthesis